MSIVGNVLGNCRSLKFNVEFVQMVDHMKFIKRKRSIDRIDKSILERVLYRFEELLDLVLFVLCIVFGLITDCVVITDKPLGPVFQYFADD